MDNEYKNTPLSYGISGYSNNPFDFDRIFRMRPWLKDPRNVKGYLKSLIEHWVLLYEWNTQMYECNVSSDSEETHKNGKCIFFVAGQLFVAMLLGQYILSRDKHSDILMQLDGFGYMSNIPKKIGKDKANQKLDDMLLNSWSEKHVTIHSVYLLFIMQMMQYNNSLEPFFTKVSEVNKEHTNKFYYNYMKSLWHTVQNSGFDMPYIYNMLNNMIRTCFNVKY